MKKNIKRILVVVLLITVIVALIIILDDYFTLKNVKKMVEYLQLVVREHYAFSVLLYIVSYIIFAAFSIPDTVLLTIGGGFLFGALLATVYINVGATIGATLAFLYIRYVIGNWVQEKYKDKLEKFNKEMELNGNYYFLTVRFIPVFPFFLINILAALTKVPIKTFIWTTSVGILPTTLVYAFAGSQLKKVESPRDIFSFEIFLVFLALAFLSILPVIVKKIKKR